jgi:SSS family solute:Na+ symporter
MLAVTLILLVIYLGFTLALGWWAYSKRTGDTEAEFFVTGWTTGFIGISFSIAATFASAGYVMGTIGVFYGNPAALTGYAFGTTFAPFLLWIIGRRLWVLGRKYRYSTYGDLLGDFYQSEKLRMTIAILVSIFFAPYLAVNLMGPGILLNQASGGSIPYWVGALAMACVGTIYTIRGGMRAVVWTDILQTLIMVVGFFVLIFMVFGAAGGWGKVWADLPDKIAAYKPGGGSFWIVLSWFWIVAFMQAGNPDRAFRLLIAKDLYSIRKGVIASLVLLNLWTTIAFLMGWSLAVGIPGVTPTDKVVGAAIAKFAPFLMPMFMIMVWAGGMSTLDSGMIGLGAMLTKDVYRRNINPKATEKQVSNLSRIITLACGVFALVVALLRPPTLWFFIAGAAAGAMQWIPLMIGALYWKRATTAGAWAGFLSGVAITALFKYVVACPIPGPGGAPILGMVANVVLFVVVSMATTPMDEKHVALYQGVFRK